MARVEVARAWQPNVVAQQIPQTPQSGADGRLRLIQAHCRLRDAAIGRNQKDVTAGINRGVNIRDDGGAGIIHGGGPDN